MRTGATDLVSCASAHALLSQHFLKPHGPGLLAYQSNCLKVLDVDCMIVYLCDSQWLKTPVLLHFCLCKIFIIVYNFSSLTLLPLLVLVFSMVQTRKQLITRDTVLSIMPVVPVLLSALNCCGHKVVLKIRRCLAGVLATHQRTVMSEPAAVVTAGQRMMKYLRGFPLVSYNV